MGKTRPVLKFICCLLTGYIQGNKQFSMVQSLLYIKHLEIWSSSQFCQQLMMTLRTYMYLITQLLPFKIKVYFIFDILMGRCCRYHLKYVHITVMDIVIPVRISKPFIYILILGWWVFHNYQLTVISNLEDIFFCIRIQCGSKIYIISWLLSNVIKSSYTDRSICSVLLSIKYSSLELYRGT